MDQYRVEDMLGDASDILRETFPEGRIDKMKRSKMSAFGAAVLMGGPLPAISYYALNEPDIIKLLDALYHKRHENINGNVRLFDIVKDQIRQNHKDIITEELLDMSVSFKMAFNLYELVDTGTPAQGR